MIYVAVECWNTEEENNFLNSDERTGADGGRNRRFEGNHFTWLKRGWNVLVTLKSWLED